jgi:hypothetical protein
LSEFSIPRMLAATLAAYEELLQARAAATISSRDAKG